MRFEPLILTLLLMAPMPAMSAEVADNADVGPAATAPEPAEPASDVTQVDEAPTDEATAPTEAEPAPPVDATVTDAEPPAATDSLSAAEASEEPASAPEQAEEAAGPGGENAPPVSFMVTASLQMESREFAAAAKILEAGVAQLEQETSRYDPALAEPLALLGDAYFGQGELVLAQDTYERAIHIERVNFGLHSAEQVPLIYREADTLAALGDFAKANERHEYAFETLQRSYSRTSLELVPGMYRLAAWYKRTHNIFGARALYQMAAENLARAYGPDSPELVLPLRGVAETYRQERFPPYEPPGPRETFAVSTGGYSPSSSVDTSVTVNRFGDGERALQEIVRILEADPETPRLEVAVAILDLADWHLLFEKWERASALYQHVRERMREEVGLSEADIASYFGQPMPLYLPLPDNPSPPPADMRRNPVEGYVEVGYTVTNRGNVTALNTLASEPEGMMDIRVRRAFRAARFRPRYEADEPVATENLKYRHRFLYFPRVDETKSEEEP